MIDVRCITQLHRSNDCEINFTHHTLCITILSTHGEIQSEEIRVDDINVTGFRSTQGIDTSVEWLICADLNCDPRILAMNGY